MKPYRLDKLASEVRQVISDAIIHRLSDPRISKFASVTRVSVAADLATADVYVSVLGDEAEGRKTLAGLTHARGRIQGLLAKAIRTRQCPHIRFHLDASIKKGDETIRLIEETVGQSEEATESTDEPGGDDE